MACTYYYFKDNDYYCQKKHDYVNSDTYWKYCRNYDYGDCPIYKESDQSSSCYLTTIVCETLAKEDNDPVLNSMRGFRDNVLQKSAEYDNILKRYDGIGPLIADHIRKDSDRLTLSEYLYDKFLSPISNYIKEKKNEKAITLYEIMTLSLINYFNLKHQYNDLDLSDKNFVREFSGHGKKVKAYN